MPLLSPLPKLILSGLLFTAGSFPWLATPASERSPLWPLQTNVDGLDDERDIRGPDWQPRGSEAAVLHGGGSGHIVDGVTPGGRPGVPLVKDPQPAMPTVLPAVPATLPRRSGTEPLGEGGALGHVGPASMNGVRELRLQMREYGRRPGEPGDDDLAAPQRRHSAGGEARWLNADERTTFREALRERHHRARH